MYGCVRAFGVLICITLSSVYVVREGKPLHLDPSFVLQDYPFFLLEAVN